MGMLVEEESGLRDGSEGAFPREPENGEPAFREVFAW